MSIISNIFEELGLSRKEDVTEELKPRMTIQNSKDMEKIINAICDTMNPYSTTIEKDHLFNLATGKAADVEIEYFLLEVSEIGRRARDEFIQECINDSSRISPPIRRQRIRSLETQFDQFKVTSATEKKLVTVTMARDLFGRILFHALQAKADMAQVLKYPLTPVPLSLCPPEGTM